MKNGIIYAMTIIITLTLISYCRNANAQSATPFYDLNENQFYSPDSYYGSDPVQESLRNSTDEFFDNINRQIQEEQIRDQESGIVLPDSYPFVWNQLDAGTKLILDDRYKRIREQNRTRIERIKKLNENLKKQLED